MNQIVSHYRVLEKLGGGGMGVVYRAEDLKLERKVALKFLPEEFSRDVAAVERFEREARLAAAINHPNICIVYEVGEFNGSPFLAMELLEGETLKKRINGKPVPVPTFLDWVVQILQGLEAAHARGIVHLDLKPANLFITEAGQVKILDFGLAKLRVQQKTAVAGGTDNTMTALQTDPSIVGTPAYMSPEQARGEDLDARSDLFSLGVLLYEMATGQLPFYGPNTGATITSLLRDSPLPPVQLNPELPPDLGRVITKALEKDPDTRYQTAAHLRADLKRVQRDIDSSQLSTTVISGLSHPRSLSKQRRKVVSLLAGTAALFIAVVSAFLLARPVPPPRVLSTTQITNDRLAKIVPFLTDGSRLYFNTGSYIAPQPYQASITGGDSVPLPTHVNSATVLDISEDGSELLVGSDQGPSSGQSPLDLDELSLWIAPVLGSSPRRVGELFVSDAAFSPDSHRIVYSKAGVIGVASGDGTEARRLASVPGTPSFPRWSPDGKRIRFTVGHEHFSSKYSGTAPVGSSLWEIWADGTHLRPLFPGWREAQCCGNWTADGRYFVFQATKDGVSTIWTIREKVGLFQAAKKNPVQLTTGPMNTYGPVPSRDGKRLFVGGREPRIEILRYDTRSKAFIPFLSGISAEGLDFTRDGKWVAYVSYPDGTLWRSMVNGEQRLQLSAAPMTASLPRWSPDGKQIAFLGHDPGKPEKIFVVGFDGGAVQQLAPAENVGDPTWSADGNSIAFSGYTPDTQQASTKVAIDVLNLTTHQVSTLPGSEELWSPRWSPDGRYIAALSTDARKLLVFDFGTRKWTELAKADFGYPSWSRNSEYIYFDTLGKDAAFFRIRIRDRKQERLVSLTDLPRKMGAFGPWAGLAPDGSPLVTRDASFDEIYALDWEAP